MELKKNLKLFYDYEIDNLWCLNDIFFIYLI